MFDNILNKKIASVELNSSKDGLNFSFEDQTIQAYGVEGDCCSHSWIEHLEMPNDIIGATILSVENLDMGTLDDPDHECLQLYQTQFNTDRGTICLEYRNSSNGYYGGWIYAKR